MATVPEIQQAILSLAQEEYQQIVDWLYELEEEIWDRQIEEDAKAGRLDVLKDQALEARRSGTLGYL